MRFRDVIMVGVIAILSLTRTYAQDPQFSQFYAGPLYLNPALTGSSQMTRAGVNYRNQWPSISATFVNYTLWADHFFIDANSGAGILINVDREGLAGLRSQSISLFYAYQLHLTRTWTFRAGFEGSYYMRDLNFSKLTFGDQFDDAGNIIGPTGEVFNSPGKVNFPDISMGGVFYNRNLWVGFSAHHITQPDQSFIGLDRSPLPRKYSVHAGYRVNIRKGSTNQLYSPAGGQRDINMYPAINYRIQGKYEQLDAGLYFDTEPILMGVWYRGIPYKKFDDLNKNESVIFLVGMNSNGLNIGYSFDYTLSAIGIRSGGAHEISIAYQFFMGNPRKPPRSSRLIPCPRL